MCPDRLDVLVYPGANGGFHVLLLCCLLRRSLILDPAAGHNSRRDAISLETAARARLPFLGSRLIMEIHHALQKTI